MAYDFDAGIERRGTDSVKHDGGLMFGKRDGLLPLWVADMDFKLPDEILDEVKATVDRGVFGYTFRSREFDDAVSSWFSRRFGWTIEGEWIVQTPGVVYAIGTALQAFCEPGDAVLIQQPVYHPFARLIEENGCKTVNNELVYDGSRYTVDFDDFERSIVENGVKLFILCSPHNPVGRVWTAEELGRMGGICIKHDVLIVSDEIHCDFVYEGHTHHVLPTVDARLASRTIVCTSPSKTFNLAGLQMANIIISDETLRTAFRDVLGKVHYQDAGIIALAAGKAAYENGEAWLEALLDYLEGTVAYVQAFLAERLPEVKLVEPEGTYLLWLDFSDLGLSEEELMSLIETRARLWLNEGSLFGTRSAQFQRMNIACPRNVVRSALEALECAVHRR